MNFVRTAGILLMLIASGLGCGTKSHADQHASHGAAAPQPPPPTPDTTPIEVLRTPAGLVLKIDAPTPPPTETPVPTRVPGN